MSTICSVDQINNASKISFKVVSTTVLEKPASRQLPIAIPEPTPLCTLPSELLITLIEWCDINSIGMLAFTCQELYHQIFSHPYLPAPLLSEILSRLLQQQNLDTIERFCKRIQPCIRPIELRIQQPWHQLPEALITIQTRLVIHGLIIQGSQILTKQAIDAFNRCLSLKKIVLEYHLLDDYWTSLTDMPSIEELQLLRVSAPYNQPYKLSEVIDHFPSLKRLIICHCVNLVTDFENFDDSSNILEYFSHDNWLYNGGSWDNYIQNRNDQRTEDVEVLSHGIHAYYLGCSYLHTSPNQELAEKFLRKSIELSPRLIHPKQQLARLLTDTQPQEAETLLRECIAIYKDDIRSLLDLGVLLTTTNRMRDGMPFLKQAALLCTHSSHAPILYGIIPRLLEYTPSIGRRFLQQAFLLKKTFGNLLLRV